MAAIFLSASSFSSHDVIVWRFHYNDVIMNAMSPASRLFIQPFVQGADQRKHQSSSSLAFVRGIHQWPVNFPHKGPVTRKMFPFDDVIMFHAQDWQRVVAIIGRLGKESLQRRVQEFRAVFLDINVACRAKMLLRLLEGVDVGVGPAAFFKWVSCVWKLRDIRSSNISSCD